MCGACEIVTNELILLVSGDDAENRICATQIKVDSTTQRIISTSEDEKLFLYIINCESTKHMWKKLESVYEQKSDSVHVLLQQQYSYEKELGDDVATHIVKRILHIDYKLWVRKSNDYC